VITRVDFEFGLNEKVNTLSGVAGLITVLAFDSGGKQYYVVTEEGGSWFEESHLTKREP